MFTDVASPPHSSNLAHCYLFPLQLMVDFLRSKANQSPFRIGDWCHLQAIYLLCKKDQFLLSFASPPLPFTVTHFSAYLDGKLVGRNIWLILCMCNTLLHRRSKNNNSNSYHNLYIETKARIASL